MANKININVEKLKSLTSEAIRIADEAKKKRDKENAQKIKRMAEADASKADSIIAKISKLCEKEAKSGESKAIVMKLKQERDYDLSNMSCDPKNLKRVGLIVWNACKEADLNPEIESWHDGIGVKGGWNIVVNW